jgi:hypothetical protein
VVGKQYDGHGKQGTAQEGSMRFLGAGGKMGFGGGAKGEDEYYLIFGYVARDITPFVKTTDSIFPFFQTGLLRADNSTLEFEYFMKCNYDSSAGADDGAQCLAEYDGKLIVGTVNYLGTSTSNNGLLLYDQEQNTYENFQGSSWNSNIFDVVKSPTGTTGNLYVTGQFTTVDGNSYNRIVKWDGSSWNALGTGLNNIGYRLAIDSSENLYVSGAFTQAGGVTVNYIAKWDGSSWSNVGGATGIANNSVVRMFCDSNDDLWVVGTFTSVQGISANRIAKWDGTNWSTFGSGANATIQDATYDRDNEEVYIVGAFTSIDGVSVDRIAKWDGLTWSNMGPVNYGSPGANERAIIHKSSSGLYLNYVPTNLGDMACVKYNEISSSWDLFPMSPERLSGIPRPRCMLEHNGKIYMGGGRFGGQVGGVPLARSSNTTSNSLCYFNRKNDEVNTSWRPNMYAYGFRVENEFWWDEVGQRLYHYGSCQNLSPDTGALLEAHYWDNANQKWVEILNTNVPVFDIERIGDYLYFIGGGIVADMTNYICKYDPSTDTFSALGTGLNNYGLCLATDGTDLYAGGEFTTAGGSTVNRLAIWNGTSWSNWGGTTGANDSVWDIIYATGDSSSVFYVGGEFTSLQGVASTRGIAMYDTDTNTWSSVGGGLGNGFIKDMAWDPFNELLYICGTFTSVGGQTLTNFAVWDGLTWGSAGNWESIRSTNYSVNNSLTAYSFRFDKYTRKLWFFGSFILQDTSADRIFNNVAIWDGVEWTPFTRYNNEDGHAGSGVSNLLHDILQVPNEWGLTFPTA